MLKISSQLDSFLAIIFKEKSFRFKVNLLSLSINCRAIILRNKLKISIKSKRKDKNMKMALNKKLFPIRSLQLCQMSSKSRILLHLRIKTTIMIFSRGKISISYMLHLIFWKFTENFLLRENHRRRLIKRRYH
jgi:hypothetical protein